MIKISDYISISSQQIIDRSVDDTDAKDELSQALMSLIDDYKNSSASANNVESIVGDIIADVRANGDAALYKYCEKFDKAILDSLEVTEDEITEAFASVSPELIDVMKEAAENISEYHKKQLLEGFEIKRDNGVILGQRVMPVAKAGLYIPGGTASYPSSVLMNCIPAKIAGVTEIILTTPPSPDGKIKPEILVASKIAGADRIFKIGGAQAIAALAYGTHSVPKVDKITGPGNCFVAEAKRQVYGIVDIDMIAGPSEILVIADKTCNPVFVAADMLSQAEHDRLASAVLCTDSGELAEAVANEIEKQLKKLPREEIARVSIENRGRIFITKDIKEAVAVSNELAPEHLEVCVDNPFELLPLITNAGSVFLGKYCPEASGDYFSGTNHTLPTSGTARFSSPLSVYDFIKTSAYSYYTPQALKEISKKVELFALSEGLHAHAKSVTIRFEESAE